MKKALVVGGGLAGCCTAYQLIERGCEVHLIDPRKNYSSAVAAGMINPLVFRRMTKSWRVDEFIPYAYSFYEELCNRTASNFFHPIVIRRFFSSQQEREFWLKKQTQEEFTAYMHPHTEEDDHFHPYANEFGSARVKNASYIEAELFLEQMHLLLAKNCTIVHGSFDYDNCDPEAKSYEGQRYDYMIFCEGFEGKKNPWFGSLPLNQTKGEVLTVKLEQVPENESLNRKCFLLPIGNQQFKVGSTYVWNTPTTNITEAGKESILHNLSFLTEETPIILEQKAGVRPTTLDRRPLMGEHPSYPGLFILNGLGTKGYMMAPLLSKELIDLILDGVKLPREYSISRFDNW